jgi:hypothetical protein
MYQGTGILIFHVGPDGSMFWQTVIPKSLGYVTVTFGVTEVPLPNPKKKWEPTHVNITTGQYGLCSEMRPSVQCVCPTGNGLNSEQVHT